MVQRSHKGARTCGEQMKCLVSPCLGQTSCRQDVLAPVKGQPSPYAPGVIVPKDFPTKFIFVCAFVNLFLFS